MNINADEFENLIAKAVYKGGMKVFSYMLTLLFLACIVISCIDLALNYSSIGRDSTDGEKRSDMAIYTDNLTGCEYLGASKGGLTPRISINGDHMGCK